MSLQKMVSTHIKYISKSATDFLVSLVTGMIATGSITQKKLAQQCETGAKVESNIKRLQRLLQSFPVDFRDHASMIFDMLKIGKDEKLTIVIDRTNWDYGEKHINIFVAAILHKGSAIPIVWDVFEKKGNSNTRERKTLINKLLAAIGERKIGLILGDREFIGNEWLKSLQDDKIDFIIRSKCNMHIILPCGKRAHLGLAMADAKIDKRKYLEGKIDDLEVRVAATKSVADELVMVISSKILILIRWSIIENVGQLSCFLNISKPRGSTLKTHT